MTGDQKTVGASRDASPKPFHEKLAVVGSGTVACQLAAVRATKAQVVVCARSARSAARASQTIAELSERLGTVSSQAQTDVTTDFDAISDCTFIIEAVKEDEFAKAPVLRTISDVSAPSAIIATTTSSLSVTKLAVTSGRRERFVGFHVFNPAHRMRLVELAFPGSALPETRLRAMSLAQSMDKTAIVVPDVPGFIVNRLLFPYLLDAVRLMERHQLTAEEVDKSITLGLSHPLGPLSLLDLIGLDTAHEVADSLGLDVPQSMSELVRQRALGRKSRRGFYDYP